MNGTKRHASSNGELQPGERAVTPRKQGHEHPLEGVVLTHDHPLHLEERILQQRGRRFLRAFRDSQSTGGGARRGVRMRNRWRSRWGVVARPFCWAASQAQNMLMCCSLFSISSCFSRRSLSVEAT